MDLSVILVRNEEYVWRIIDGEAIILSPSGDRLHSLNQMGTLIWKHADGKNTIEDIINIICLDYDVNREKAKEDVIGFAEKLHSINAFISS